MFTAVLCKGMPGEVWDRLFRGDSDGLRCLKPPYCLTGEELTHHSRLYGILAFESKAQIGGATVTADRRGHPPRFLLELLQYWKADARLL